MNKLNPNKITSDALHDIVAAMVEYAVEDLKKVQDGDVIVVSLPDNSNYGSRYKSKRVKYIETEESIKEYLKTNLFITEIYPNVSSRFS